MIVAEAEWLTAKNSNDSPLALGRPEKRTSATEAESLVGFYSARVELLPVPGLARCEFRLAVNLLRVLAS